ncbi:MAG: MarR family transcriptional regulator [Nanoarchaeota archaeon]|nr:MarR family transcriptional regulator [Nanoarchaeota archaeon]
MGQAEVLKILKKARKWMLVKEIAKLNGNGKGSMSCNLNKLFEQGLVERKRV